LVSAEQRKIEEVKNLLTIIGTRFGNLRDKPDQQFLFWFMWMNFKWGQGISQDPPEDVMNYLCDNGNDQSIDGFYFYPDPSVAAIYVVQSKYTRHWNEPGTIPYKELKRTADIIQYFENPTEDSIVYLKANEKCRRLLGKAYQYYRAGNSLRILFVCNRNSPDPDNLTKLEQQTHIDLNEWNFEIYDRSRILALYEEYLQGHNPPIPAQFIRIDQKNAPIYVSVGGGLEAYVASAPSSELVDLYNRWEDRIFESNVRGWEGDSRINDRIADSLKRKPDLFFYMNSGVTILADELRPESKREGQPAGFWVKDIQIINGQQTTRVLAKNPRKETMVLLTLMAPVKSKRQPKTKLQRVTTEIIRARNTQNKIDEADLKSNDAVQVQLWRDFKDRGYFYERKDRGWQNLPDYHSRSIYSLASENRWAIVNKKKLAALTIATIDDPTLAYAGADYLFGQRYSHLFGNGRFTADYYLTLHLLFKRCIYPLGFKVGKTYAQYHILRLLLKVLGISKTNAVSYRAYLEGVNLKALERIVMRLYRLCDNVLRDLQKQSHRRLSYNDVYGKRPRLLPTLLRKYNSPSSFKQKRLIEQDARRIHEILTK
jgi:hypothetical protein